MNPEDINRMLRHEPRIRPSPGFTARVMDAVRMEDAQSRAIRFPWQVLAAGLTAAAGLTVIALVAGAAGGQPVAPETLVDVEKLYPPLKWLSLVSAGTFALGKLIGD